MGAYVKELFNLMNLRMAAAPLAAFVLFAPTAALAQQGQTISEIEFRGVKSTSRFALELATKLKPGAPFDNAQFQADIETIKQQGLYATVGGRTETRPDGRLAVVYDVVENPTVTNIVVTGNRAIKTEEIRKQVQTKEGQVLNTNILEQDIQRVQRLYADAGYIAFPDARIGIDPRTGILTIPMIETTVESIQIENNKKTRPYVILREMKTKPGEVFNRNVFQRDLSRVYNLGIFEDFGNVRQVPGSDVGKVGIILPVQERRTGQVAVGLGYSTRQRLVGRLELSESNFRGRGQGLNFAWEVGGVASRNSFEVGFTEPWIDRRNTSLSVNLFDRVVYRFSRAFSEDATQGQDDDPYYERRRGGSVTLSRPFTDTTRGFITARTEAIKANNLRLNYNNLTNDEVANIRGSLVQNGDVNALTFRTATNTRDNDLDPASGFFFSPAVEVGRSKFDYEKPRINPNYISDTATPGIPRILFDQRAERGPFAKYNLDARSYFSLNGRRQPGSLTQPKRVIATRVLVGTSSGNIGFSEQYFIGGAETLRGYRDDRFWGNNLFLASAELRLPFDNRGTVTGVLFTDIGDAWGASEANREDIEDFRQHGNFSPSLGAGLGIRLRTPIGPIRLDYGFGEVSRLHFSIGQAF